MYTSERLLKMDIYKNLNNLKNSEFQDHHKLLAILDKSFILSGSCGVTVILLKTYIITFPPLCFFWFYLV